MKKIEKQQEIKASLLEDMLSFITYTANRESDILAFMGLYQKAEPECRFDILSHLRACMDSFYVVSPAGAIGLCNDGEDIDWLFLSDGAPNEDLPLTYQAEPQIKFCSKCGSRAVLGARFCGQCGTAL